MTVFRMFPDLAFWLALLLKMAVTALFVIAASYAAERAGPVVGAMIATLPIAAGPAYFFLARSTTMRRSSRKARSQAS